MDWYRATARTNPNLDLRARGRAVHLLETDPERIERLRATSTLRGKQRQFTRCGMLATEREEYMGYIPQRKCGVCAPGEE